MRVLMVLVLLIAAGIGVKTMLDHRGGQAEAVSAERELITVISKGERVDLEQLVPDEGVVLVEFMADW